MADNPLQRLKELDQERAGLIDGAKQEALTRAHQAIEDLKALGFSYALTQEAGRGPRKAASKARTPSEGPCPICKFETDPHHDGRAHRGQGEKKKPFTAKELEQLEMSKV